MLRDLAPLDRSLPLRRLVALFRSAIAGLGGRRSWRLVERNLVYYRHQWPILVSGFFEPLFYLLGLGVGVGSLVGPVAGPDGRPVAYGAFVAPALLATSAMNGAIYEATYNFFGKLRWQKTYQAIVATPLRMGDVALGELLWALIRSGLYSAAFLAVIVAWGLTRGPWVVLALPATLLLGFAVGAAGMAATTYLRNWTDLDLVTLVTLPVFLFSGTFYPVTVYPEPWRSLVWLSPLYHGSELLRRLTLGMVDPALLVHIGFLVLLGTAGLLVAGHRLERRLTQ